MATYQLISSDSHIIEPADLWQERIDRPFRGRAPRLVHEAEADQWYADGIKFGAIGINQQAGVRFETPEHLVLLQKLKSATFDRCNSLKYRDTILDKSAKIQFLQQNQCRSHSWPYPRFVA
jgi:hypothetical protein